MTKHQKTIRQAIILIMTLDDTDVSICIEAIKSGYLNQDHTETELQDYMQKARRQWKQKVTALSGHTGVSERI